MVGAYIALPMATHLRLLSVYYETSLQDIVEQALSDWCVNKNKSGSEIMGELVGRACAEWERRKKEQGGAHNQRKYLEYLKELENRLKRKKIPWEHIEVILTRVENRLAQEMENEKNS